MTDAGNKEQGMKTKGETREHMGIRIKDADEHDRKTNPDGDDKSVESENARQGEASGS